jgi:hypothetical protein
MAGLALAPTVVAAKVTCPGLGPRMTFHKTSVLHHLELFVKDLLTQSGE